jgi:mono/diheme cytochrome c family protein
MKLISLALTCVAIALLSIACTETATPTNTNTSRAAATPATPSPSPSVDPLATARANYAKNCEACHGESGTGGLVKVDNTDDQLIKVITGGEEEMPAFKDKLSQQEIADLVRFVRKEFQGKP